MRHPAPESIQRDCVLVSAGCTTGWTDWIHGELWLCPDGLLRRALGFVATFRHGVFSTVTPARRPIRTFAPRDIETILKRSRRNQWIQWDIIRSAHLVPSRLDMQLHDGGRVTLMWPPVDDISPLRENLPTLLGARLNTS